MASCRMRNVFFVGSIEFFPINLSIELWSMECWHGDHLWFPRNVGNYKDVQESMLLKISYGGAMIKIGGDLQFVLMVGILGVRMLAMNEDGKVCGEACDIII